MLHKIHQYTLNLNVTFALQATIRGIQFMAVVMLPQSSGIAKWHLHSEFSGIRISVENNGMALGRQLFLATEK